VHPPGLVLLFVGDVGTVKLHAAMDLNSRHGPFAGCRGGGGGGGGESGNQRRFRRLGAMLFFGGVAAALAPASVAGVSALAAVGMTAKVTREMRNEDEGEDDEFSSGNSVTSSSSSGEETTTSSPPRSPVAQVSNVRRRQKNASDLKSHSPFRGVVSVD